MNLTACVGLGGTASSLKASVIHRARPRQHFNVDDNFFEGKNYRLVLERLDSGYDVGMNIIRSMKGYRDLRLNYAGALSSHSNQMIAQLQQQSPLACYHTAKRAQIQTARSFNDQATAIRGTCDQVQQVTKDYQTQIDRMYPQTRFNVNHKHYQTARLKRLFKNAYGPLQRVLNKLVSLHNAKKKAQDLFQRANIEHRNLLDNPTVDKNQLKRAYEKRETKRKELSNIEANIIESEDDRDKKKMIYREEAMNILVQCEELEEERLEQIKQTLINYTRAIHSREFSIQLDDIYEHLLNHITNEQNTNADIHFWRQTYVLGIATDSETDNTHSTANSQVLDKNETSDNDQQDSSTDEE